MTFALVVVEKNIKIAVEIICKQNLLKLGNKQSKIGINLKYFSIFAIKIKCGLMKILLQFGKNVKQIK